MWHPTIQDVIVAHDVVASTGHIRTSGFRRSREDGLRAIRSILDQARHEDGLHRSAAVYLRGLIDHHPFSDGNKRTAVLVTDRFLDENDAVFTPYETRDTEKLYKELKWKLPTMDIPETASWIRDGDLPR